MRSFGQKILFDFDDHKFAMTDKGKKDVIGIVKFDRLIGLLPTHPTKLLYYNGIPEFMRRLFSVNIKIKQRKKVEILLPKIKLTEALAAIIGKISYSNLETGRYSPKSGVSQMWTALCRTLCKPFRH